MQDRSREEQSSPRYARTGRTGRTHRLVVPGQEEQGGLIASLCTYTAGAERTHRLVMSVSPGPGRREVHLLKGPEKEYITRR